MKALIRTGTRAGLIALCTLTMIVAPADARPTPVRSSHVWEDIVELEQDVNRADNRDTISEREAAGLRNQIAELKGDYHRMNRNGLTRAQAGKLESRIHALRARLRHEKADPDGHRH